MFLEEQQTASAHYTSADLLKQEVVGLGDSLREAFRVVLNSPAISSVSSTEASRRLGVSQPVMSRVVRAVQTSDPIVLVHTMPGPEPLRRILRAARQVSGDVADIDRADVLVDEFERIIKTVAKDRGGFDTILSGWLPEVRKKTDLSCRQAVFRGMSQIKGVNREATINAFFIDPTADGRVRSIAIEASIGLRRLRPGTRVVDGAGGGFGEDFRSISGEPIKRADQLYIEEFCSAPIPDVEIEAEHAGDCLFTLNGDTVGQQSAIDLVWGSQAMFNTIPPKGELGAAVSTPSKLWCVYAFVHGDVLYQDPPPFRLYDTTIYGMLDRRDKNRENTALGPIQKMTRLGSNALEVHNHTMPHFNELVTHICTKSGSDPASYHCFGVEHEYPVHGSAIQLTFRGDD